MSRSEVIVDRPGGRETRDPLFHSGCSNLANRYKNFASNWCGATIVLLLLLATVPARAAELVMYEQAGCPYCLQWDMEIGPGYPMSPEGARAPLRRQQLSDRSAANFTLRQPVTMTPTFVLIEDSREVGRITGYMGSDFFYVFLDDLLATLPNKEINGAKEPPIR